jgi:hypothetical protein
VSTANLVTAFGLALALTTCTATVVPAADDGSLSRARTLYTAADYEGALDLLATTGSAATDDSDLLRALCLLALGRMDDLDRVLQSIATRDSGYRPPSDVTPRLLTLFDQARQRAMPGVARARYAHAKAQFDAGDFAAASRQFAAVLAMLPDDSALGNDGSLVRDLRPLSEGFLRLSNEKLAAAKKTLESGSAGPDAKAAPAAADTLAAVDTGLRERLAIRGLVQRYADAYSSLDVHGVIAVFPGDSAKTIGAAFAALKSQHIDARDVLVTVDPDGQHATATLKWVVNAVPRVGGARRLEVPATLALDRSTTGEWFIVSRQ